MKLNNVLTIFLLIAVSACLVGCASYSTSKQSVNLRPVDITTTAFKPNYEVDDKAVSATAVQKHFLFFGWGDADLITDEVYDERVVNPKAKRLQKAAVTKACLEADCDILVGTTFQFQRTSYLICGSLKCTVKGFPARVKSVEEIGGAYK